LLAAEQSAEVADEGEDDGSLLPERPEAQFLSLPVR
jgi:hypothetical protein